MMIISLDVFALGLITLLYLICDDLSQCIFLLVRHTE